MRKSIYILLGLFLLFPFLAEGRDKDKDEFVVVIDPGHGGKDVGATDNGVNEKDINLGVALKLGQMIKEKHKDVKVVYTRDNDNFVSLQGRADKANKAKGNLFISIHTNSVDKKNPNRKTVAGASTYALGLHKDKNNMEVARRENSVIELEKDHEQKYSGFDPNSDESYIIFEMAQKKNLSQSLHFADKVQKEMAKGGRKDRGVHQAGFWVLWATAMPAVLVELDFICNPNSAKFMGSDTGQKHLAEAIFKAFETYHKEYKKSFAGVTLPGEEVEQPKEAGQVLQLASASKPPREVTAAPVQTAVRSYGAKRRRRSQAAREKSLRQNYESDNVFVFAESDAVDALEGQVAEEVLLAVVEEDKPAEPVKKNKEKKSKPKKGRTVGGRKVEVVLNSDDVAARRKKSGAGMTASLSGKRHAGAVATVFKIQILTSDHMLKKNAPEFHGLKDVAYFKEGNIYKYTIGESENRREMDALLKKVRDKIPDAFIITSTKDSRNH